MYSTLAKHVIYQMVQIYKRRDTLRQLKELERTQWLPTDEIKKIQWIKLKKLLEYAYINVPYYQQVFKTLNMTPKDITIPDDFRKLPLLDKEDIRSNISDIVSSSCEKKDLIKDSTGGSTGINLRFFYDTKSIAHRSAVALRSDSLAGLDIGDKHVKLWGSPFDISRQNSLKGKISKLISRSLYLSSYDLSEDTMYKYTKKLLQYKPKVIIGYSSSLYLFAKFLEENKIKGISPKSIISSAEVLYDYQRELIESVFGCKVFNRYGCREFSTIAQECSEHSGMHINAEHVYVECLKEGEPAALGETGELIITDLDNYGMPFIRYKIGDVGVLSDRICNCGRGLPIIETIEGRTFDIIVGTNGRYFDGHFFSILLRTAVDGIKQFQVVQESKNEINIRIVVDKIFRTKYIDTLTSKIHEYCGEDMQVNFKILEAIPLTKSGKFRFVISKVASDFGRDKR